MIIDKELLLSDKQVVTATAASTDVIDMSKGGDAEGRPLEVVIQVNETVTADGAATVTFALETDDNTDFSSPKALWSSGTLGKATLVNGYAVFSGKLPRGAERYVRVNYTVGTGPLTKGKFSAFLTNGVQKNSFM